MVNYWQSWLYLKLLKFLALFTLKPLKERKKKPLPQEVTVITPLKHPQYGRLVPAFIRRNPVDFLVDDYPEKVDLVEFYLYQVLWRKKMAKALRTSVVFIVPRSSYHFHLGLSFSEIKGLVLIDQKNNQRYLERLDPYLCLPNLKARS